MLLHVCDDILIKLDIIHRPVFYIKHDVSKTGFCLRLQIEPTQLGKSPEAETSSIYWA
jgi:hypothetical protein